MAENGTHRVITISSASIIKVAIFFLTIAFVYLIRDIILLFFISLILASIINPMASKFQSRRLPRAVTVLMLYVVIIAVLATILTVLVPAVIYETRDLLKNADAIVNHLIAALGPLREFVSAHGLSDSLQQALTDASSSLGRAAGGLVATVTVLAHGVVSFVIVLVVAFYLVVSEDGLKRLFRNVAPEPYQPYLVDLFQRIENGIGSWVRGQLILSTIVASLVYVALTALGIKYALVLALTIFVAEFIPYIGPITAAIPAVLIGFTQSPIRGLLVAIVYLLIQQTDTHILVPTIMRKVTGLHPIVSIFSLLIGIKLAGLPGALMAIPVAMVASIVAGDAFRYFKAQK